MTFEALGGAYGSMIWSLGDPRVGCDLGQAVPFPDLSFPPQKKKKKEQGALHSSFRLQATQRLAGKEPPSVGETPTTTQAGPGAGRRRGVARVGSGRPTCCRLPLGCSCPGWW